MTQNSTEGSGRSPLTVAIVGAKTPGNVGTAARAMKNFGFSKLILVDPPSELSNERAFAGQARDDVLAEASERSFDELVNSYHTVGCTAIPNESDSKHVRYPVATPTSLAERLRTVDGKTALVFGRERIGLTNDELARIDEICSIPANPEYPVLNLGQAITVTLYELRSLGLSSSQIPDIGRTRAPKELTERMYDHWNDLLDSIDHPPEKREKTMRMIRRVYGRADLTEREVNTFLGVLRRASDHRR